MTRAAQHSSKSVEHYGPPGIGDMVREVFGGDIDLDPASCEQANTLIGAKKFYSSDGLDRPWSGNVYLNPPGGQIRREGRKHNQAALWYATLAHGFQRGRIRQAIFMVFNLELFRYAQRWAVRHPLSFPVCFPADRIDFFKPGPDGRPVPQGAPAHPNSVIYMGPNESKFAEVFGRWGAVISRDKPIELRGSNHVNHV